MTNVVPFPQTNQFIQNRRQRGEMWMKFFADVQGDSEAHCAYTNVLFNLHRVGPPVDVQVWADLGVDLIWNQDTRSEFRLQTEFRKNLVPEFAVSDHTEFVSLVMDCVDALPIDSKPVPDNLLQELSGYVTGQFPMLIDTGLFSFMIRVLASIVESPNVRYIQHGVENGKFVATFYDVVGDAEKHVYALTYTADNLPTLLDSEARRMWLEGRETEST